MKRIAVAVRPFYDDAEEFAAVTPSEPRSQPQSFPYAAALRRELIERSRIYAGRHGLLCRESYGREPTVCYLPSEDEARHGNFLPQAYRSIQKDDSWRRRLEKSHTSAKRSLPHEDRRWRELDSCISSDALLMNVFCYPGTIREKCVLDMLGVESGAVPQFGVKARVPLANGRPDRTEVDMKLGAMLVEAKLTESDFQTKAAFVVEGYRDFGEVFERDDLKQGDGRYFSYQLIRNVLAAQANQCCFCVMIDARRPDLQEAWFGVMRAIRLHDLRMRCKMITWQELAGVMPPRLQQFLDEKYGIIAG